MKWFYDLRIALKLFIICTIILLFTTVQGIFAVVQLTEVNQASADITANSLPRVRYPLEAKVALARIRTLQLQHLLPGNESNFAINEKLIDEQLEALSSIFDKYVSLIHTETEKAEANSVKADLMTFIEMRQAITARIHEKNIDEARNILLKQTTPVYLHLFGALDKIAKINVTAADATSGRAEEIYEHSRTLIFVILAGCVGLGLLLSIWVARTISHPLQDAMFIAERIARGDLTADIRSFGRDETGRLMESLKAMQESLLRIVSQVREGTDTISTASREITVGNLDLSSRTEQQAGSLEETASAMEQLTSTVKQNADNASQANQLANSASEVAVKGGSVVAQVINTMGTINDSSRKIADIIGVIDSIAFQTNILALNAAVEAARAGEQGRGFAVVASEVRSLAQRAASAAKEIKSLIDDSVAQVVAGSTLVEHAGATITEVVTTVRHLKDIVAEITLASQEQSKGISEINCAITQMDEVGQQNAALVEQATGATSSLQEQAEKLSGLVSVFQLSRAHTSHPSGETTPIQKIVPKPLSPTRSVSIYTPALRRRTGLSVDSDGGNWEQF